MDIVCRRFVPRVNQGAWQVELATINRKQSMTEPEIGRVILVLAACYYPVIQYFEELFIELLSGSGKRRRRNRLSRWQRKLYAPTVGPEILKRGALTRIVFGEHETKN